MNLQRIRALTVPAVMLAVVLLASHLPAQTRPAPTRPVPASPAAQKATSGGAPVLVGDSPIFYVHERTFSFSPEDRAKAISAKIRTLSKGTLSAIQAIKVVNAETTSEIVSGETVIMTITERDAATAGRPRGELAADYARKIRVAAESLRQQYSLTSILLGVLWSALASVAFILVLKLLGMLSPRLVSLVRSWRGRYIRSIRIQKLEILGAERIADALLLGFRIARLVVVLILTYLYLSLVFSFFPWTRGYAAALLSLILYPLRTVGAAFVEYLPNVFFVLVIVTVSFYALKIVKFAFREIGKGTISWPGFYPEWADTTYAIARFLIIAFTLIVAFPYLPGSKSPAFQGVSIFLGLLLSLGSSSAIANVIAGSVLTYTRAFQVGDRVKVGDAIGDVIEKSMLVTRIRTIKNVDISIPNGMVLNSHIINFSSSAQEAGLILNTSVTIGYDTPWQTVHELLIKAAESTESILKDPRPFVLQTSLGDFYVTYEVNAFTSEPNKMAVIYSELHQKIQNEFNEAGVEIMSPHYHAVRDGNQTAIPSDSLPRGYSAPSFRILSVGEMRPAREE